MAYARIYVETTSVDPTITRDKLVYNRIYDSELIVGACVQNYNVSPNSAGFPLAVSLLCTLYKGEFWLCLTGVLKTSSTYLIVCNFHSLWLYCSFLIKINSSCVINMRLPGLNCITHERERLIIKTSSNRAVIELLWCMLNIKTGRKRLK